MDFILDYVDPTGDPQWDQMIATFPDANVFHSASWARTLKDSYGFEPLYATWTRGGKPVCVVPLMEVSSVLTGKRGVSLPFTDWCPFLTDTTVPGEEIRKSLMELGRSRGWKTLEVRESEQPLSGDDALPTYLVHDLDLSPGEEELFKQFRDSTRRNIRKASKLDVTVIEDNTRDGLKEFVRLNRVTRREHGLPPQPPVFFENLFTNLVQQGTGRILLARHEGVTVASSIYLSFNGRALYKYGASDRTRQHLRANNLLMWEAIRKYAADGARSLHFGKTDSDQAGLLQFKRGWGAVEKGLTYHKYKLPAGDLEPFESLTFGVHNRIFSRMPLPFLQLIGKLLYRHMG